MSTIERRHAIVEHIWRFARALILFIGVVIWLAVDGFTGWDVVILLCALLAHLVEQFHGYICQYIEKLLHWQQTFKSWE